MIFQPSERLVHRFWPASKVCQRCGLCHSDRMGCLGRGCFGWWIYIQRFIPTHMGLLKDRGNKPTKNKRFFIRFGFFAYFFLFASHEGFRMGCSLSFVEAFFGVSNHVILQSRCNLDVSVCQYTSTVHRFCPIGW